MRLLAFRLERYCHRSFDLHFPCSSVHFCSIDLIKRSFIPFRSHLTNSAFVSNCSVYFTGTYRQFTSTFFTDVFFLFIYLMYNRSYNDRYDFHKLFKSKYFLNFWHLTFWLSYSIRFVAYILYKYMEKMRLVTLQNNSRKPPILPFPSFMMDITICFRLWTSKVNKFMYSQVLSKYLYFFDSKFDPRIRLNKNYFIWYL